MTKYEEVEKLKARISSLEAQRERMLEIISRYERFEEYVQDLEHRNSQFDFENKDKKERLEVSLKTPFKDEFDSKELYKLLSEYIEEDEQYCIESFCGKKLSKGVPVPNQYLCFWIDNDRPSYTWKKDYPKWKLHIVLQELKRQECLNESIHQTARLFFGTPDIRTHIYRREGELGNSIANAKEREEAFRKKFLQKLSERRIQK